MNLTYPDVAAILGTTGILVTAAIKLFSKDKTKNQSHQQYHAKDDDIKVSESDYKARGVQLTEHEVKIEKLEEAIHEIKKSHIKMQEKINLVFEKILHWISD